MSGLLVTTVLYAFVLFYVTFYVIVKLLGFLEAYWTIRKPGWMRIYGIQMIFDDVQSTCGI